MKKRSFLMVGAVLITAAALVLVGCGKSPKSLGEEGRKLEQQAEALNAAGAGKSDPRVIKLMTRAAGIIEQRDKFSE
jgi:predicted component of type VI protein secretion system